MKFRDDWILRAAVLNWLRYRRGCPLVMFERCPLGREYVYRPDIVGITKARYVTEIEVKKSMADFRANEKKRGLKAWSSTHVHARQFYFAVPPELVESVRPELPDGAGLLSLGATWTSFGPEAAVEVRAPVNRDAPRLDISQIVRAARNQTGSLCSTANQLAKWQRESEAQT